MQHIFKFFINICLLFIFYQTSGQKQLRNNTIETSKEQLIDSLKHKKTYGLRLGIDISKPLLHQFNKKYNGFEFVADYRVSKNIYIATEFGFEENNSQEIFTNSTATGNYARIGLNLNKFKNWLDMNNELLVGFRYGYSRFNQTLNSFTPNVTDAQNGVFFPVNEVFVSNTTKNLNAHWTELVIGFKVEVFNNIFLSASGTYKIMLSVDSPKNFKTLYAPGFNRVFESNTGFGFNYTVSYLIPLKKN